MDTMAIICEMARYRRLNVGDLIEDINKGEWKILMAIKELAARQHPSCAPCAKCINQPGASADCAGVRNPEAVGLPAGGPAATADAASANSGGGPVRVSDITNMLGMSGPALSRWLRSLEQKQFIQRETDPEDRRNTLVSLTKEGLAKTREICEILNEFMRNITVRMGEERMQALFAELSELADIAGEEIERKRNEKSL